MLACQILLAAFIPSLALRRDIDKEGDQELHAHGAHRACSPAETFAYNHVAIPRPQELADWKEALSTAGPLASPIGEGDGLIIDVAMRMAMLPYGRMVEGVAFTSFSTYASKGDETPSMGELLVRGKAEHKKITGAKATWKKDDSPYAAVYIIRLSDGGVGLVFSFKGSTNLKDWARNLDFLGTHFEGSNNSHMKVHRGFQAHANSIWTSLKDAVTDLAVHRLLIDTWNIQDAFANEFTDYVTHGTWSWCICVGHSLGGAMADIFAEKIVTRYKGRNRGPVYAVTIDAPIPGNKAFNLDMAQNILPHGGLRIENPGDPVPWTGYGGITLRKRQVHGMQWRLPKPSTKFSLYDTHTLFPIEAQSESGNKTCRLYTFQDYDPDTDPQDTWLQNYHKMAWVYGAETASFVRAD